jgi:hypothetical protein
MRTSGAEVGGDIVCIVVGMCGFPFIGWWSVLVGFIAGFVFNLIRNNS